MTVQDKLKMIYRLAKKAGMSGEQGKEDLHALVSGLCGKESLKALTDSEYAAVISELQKRAGTSNTYKSKCTGNAKGMTKGQEGKIWRLMYELEALDKEPSKASLKKRLCSVIKKELKIDAAPDKPLLWLGFDEASKLIEVLKRYVSSTEKRITRGG